MKNIYKSRFLGTRGIMLKTIKKDDIFYVESCINPQSSDFSTTWDLTLRRVSHI